MLVALVCLPATPLAQATSWTGEPGAQWSPEEVLAVKAKIHEVILKSKRVYSQYKKIHPDHEAAEDTHDMPNAAKLLRLGFHDCLPTAGGTACDGCLNPTGMRTNPLKKYNIDGGGKVGHLNNKINYPLARHQMSSSLTTMASASQQTFWRKSL